jgi:hypothetical protein
MWYNESINDFPKEEKMIVKAFMDLPSYVNRTVRDLNGMRKFINPNPPYQRDSVWKKKQNQEFMFSLLRWGNTGIITFVIPLTQTSYRYDNADGKQRLNAIFDFLDDKYPFHKKCDDLDVGGKVYVVKGKFFSQLPRELQERIEEYTVSIYTMKNVSLEDVFSYVYNINRNTPFSPEELRNAMSGIIRDYLAEISTKTNIFFHHLPINNHRFLYTRLAAQMFMIIKESGVYDLVHSFLVSKVYDDYQLRYVGIPDNIKNEFENVLKIMDKILAHNTFTKKDFRVYMKKAQVINLFNLVYYLEKNKIRVNHNQFFNWYLKTEKTRLQSSEYTDSLTKHSTVRDVVYARFTKLLRDFNRSFPTKFKFQLDGRRTFTEKQKEELLLKSNHVCQVCNLKIEKDKIWHAHHIIEWINGGKTEVKNGQVLCKKCHEEKTKNMIVL